MKSLMTGLLMMCGALVFGETPRIAVLDFVNEATLPPDTTLAGGVHPADLARKGAYELTAQLVKNDAYNVVDRRDITSKLKDGEAAPSFIHAAQTLRADAVLRGVLLSFSTERNSYTRGERAVDLLELSVTVMVQALDAIDGTVLAASRGSASSEFRRTANTETQLGETALMELLGDALESAVKDIDKDLSKRLKSRAERERVDISIASTEDPAIVEIDGVVVGSTPLEGLQVYKGDHTLVISRPGYVTMRKRLALDGPLKLTAPMLRTEITAEERLKILSGAEMKMFLTNGQPDVWIQNLD